MIEIDIPGYGTLRLEHLVLDYNGTLSRDGKLLPGVVDRIRTLSRHLAIHVLTADTFGSVKKELSMLPCRLYIIPREEQAEAKASYTAELGIDRTVCVGNGRNDRLMLKRAALGIAVLQDEGTAAESLMAADLSTPGILEALDLLLFPRRLIATLRS
ncbi:MAG: ATPase P [Deltaproteobacteria bacterium]|nr:ATPase P [Deltaproteobacteria bacterium]